MSFKSQITKESEKKINKQKGNNQMKDKSTLKTVVTVLITLVSVATIVASFIVGMNYQKGVDSDVKTQVKELSAIMSKPAQQ